MSKIQRSCQSTFGVINLYILSFLSCPNPFCKSRWVKGFLLSTLYYPIHTTAGVINMYSLSFLCCPNPFCKNWRVSAFMLSTRCYLIPTAKVSPVSSFCRLPAVVVYLWRCAAPLQNPCQVRGCGRISLSEYGPRGVFSVSSALSLTLPWGHEADQACFQTCDIPVRGAEGSNYHWGYGSTSGKATPIAPLNTPKNKGNKEHQRERKRGWEKNNRHEGKRKEKRRKMNRQTGRSTEGWKIGRKKKSKRRK